MNLFKRYGIKEVADVVFYSITKIGDEEFYTPVLKLDTLKVSTIEKSAEKVSASGGKGNKKLITWNFGKELTLNLTDALFSPASMSMIWGGELQAKLSPYTSAIAKISIANKYGALHYSTKAYPSPALTDEEWDIVFQSAHMRNTSGNTYIPSHLGKGENKNIYWEPGYSGDSESIEENRKYLKEHYYKRDWVETYVSQNNIAKYNNDQIAEGGGIDKLGTYYLTPFNIASWKAASTFSTFSYPEEKISKIYLLPKECEAAYQEWFKSQTAMPETVVAGIFNLIDNIKKLGRMETQIYDAEVIDRMETCIVKNPYGLRISTKTQKENLMRYYRDDQSTSFVIYYDVNTMLPLMSVTEEGVIRGWVDEKIVVGTDSANQIDNDANGQDDVEQDVFTLRPGTKYIKWSRTIKRKTSDNDGSLGKTFVIDADTFPEAYKIIGETYIRDEKTGKDQRFQFIIHRAKVSSDTSLTLEAEGDPTTFDMQIDVLTPKNNIQMELKEFDVTEDYVHGGTRIVPQRSVPIYTQTNIEQKEKVNFTNDELY